MRPGAQKAPRLDTVDGLKLLLAMAPKGVRLQALRAFCSKCGAQTEVRFGSKAHACKGGK